MPPSEPIVSIVYEIVIPSYDTLEFLIMQSVASLILPSHVTVQYRVTPNTGSIRMTETTTNRLTQADSTGVQVASGWKGVVRRWMNTTSMIPTTPVAQAQVESWWDAVDQTLVVLYQHEKAGGESSSLYQAAVQDFVHRVELYLFQYSQTFLVGSTMSCADVVVAQVMAALVLKSGSGIALASQVRRWMETTLQRLQTLISYTEIPGWRTFGLTRCNCWQEWLQALAGLPAVDDAMTADVVPLAAVPKVVAATPAPAAAAPAPAPAATPAPAPAATPAPAPTATPAAAGDFDADSNPVMQNLKSFGITPVDVKLHADVPCNTAEELVTNVPLADKQTHTKNLFLKDKKHGMVLIVVHPSTTVNTKELGKILNVSGKINFRMADANLLQNTFHVKSGHLGVLALTMASDAVKQDLNVLLDQALFEDGKWDTIYSHPLRNDVSVGLAPNTLLQLLKDHVKLGKEAQIIDFGGSGAPPAAGAPAPAPAPKAPKAPQQPKKGKAPAAGGDPPMPSNKKSNKKGETLLALQWKKAENFPQWYSDVITLSEMISYYDISGCYVLRPWSYKMWELIQVWFNDKIEALGVENAYFPLFVSQDRLEKEKDHVEGFAPEVAWVTKSGSGDLAKPIAVRPTSETIMYPAYSDWIQSHRDLPLKLNQWSNVVRWEFKYPTPFLRTREFLWQEGHTAHATFEEADKMVMDALDLYRRVYEELLAVPVVPGYKTEKEKFAGGYRTTTVEAYIAGSGRAIQGATSHHLGQNFGKMFDITYQNAKGQSETVWQTSWGLTTRTIGVMVMTHGDDTGLVLPPKVAPLQVVIVSIINKKFTQETAQPYCDSILKDLQAHGIRAKYDDRTIYNPGWKYNHWEQKGVPIRIEVGPRDVQNKSARLVFRYNGEKTDVAVDGMGAHVAKLLEDIQAAMFAKAKAARDTHVVQVTEWKNFVPALEQNNLVLTPWCGGEYQDWEDKVKELSREESLAARGEEAEDEKTSTSVAAKTLCIPFDQPALPEGTKCIISDLPAKCWILWGRSY